MNKLRSTLSQTWLNIQSSLFPWLSEELGELTDKPRKISWARIYSASYWFHSALESITCARNRDPTDFSRINNKNGASL